ncbi:hypothetical protein CC86DRAFT_453711 [Ophiobolus disseminans]|uniref:Uncharacterized protein n=1 Tax=Ophiobolus disseminans TaxID=1469910 RepID=A0A6A7A6Y8_9PLEO|nr:hypothetical protein CC86DRAFT_453711 [Ophiobolus disseminans]
MFAHALAFLALLAPLVVSSSLLPNLFTCLKPKPVADRGVYICQGSNFAQDCGFHPVRQFISQKESMKFHSIGPDLGVYCIFYTEADGKGAALVVNGVKEFRCPGHSNIQELKWGSVGCWVG